MNGTSGRVLVAALAAASAVACGSSGDKGSSGTNGGCTTPEIVGTVFGGTGTASVTGVGTLPEGIKDGLEVGVLIDLPNESLGVLPDDIFTTNDRVCGKTVRTRRRPSPRAPIASASTSSTRIRTPLTRSSRALPPAISPSPTARL